MKMERKIKRQFRQGDVFFVEYEEEIKGKKADHLTLALGEATGHKHQILDLSAADLFIDAQGNMILKVKDKEAVVIHEEHLPVVLPSGNYEVRIQREYTAQSFRRVAD